MRAEQRRPAPDEEWFRLTEDLVPYERFKFIAGHVLTTALKEAATYAKDSRIFADAAGEGALRAHLEILDLSLRGDAGLSNVEREFLCAAVAAAMRALKAKPICLADVIRDLAASGSNGGSATR